MNNAQRLAAGAGIAVWVTLAAMVAPGGWGESTSPAGVGQTATPFPSAGTVPVVTSPPPKAKSSVSPSGASKKSAAEKTHDSSANAPYGDAESVRKEARIIAENAARLQSRGTSSLTVTAAAKKKPKITYIKGYSFCGWSVREAQRCIDQGKLTRYKPSGVNTLAGHNYKGWYWIDDIPTGRIVKIQSGQLKGTYKVYGHAKVYDKKFPKSGLGAAVALQTCEGSGIGFSFLRRV